MNKYSRIQKLILKDLSEHKDLEGITSENIRDYYKNISWEDFEVSVEFLIRERLITNSVFADDGLVYFRSEITLMGMNYLEGLKLRNKIIGIVSFLGLPMGIALDAIDIIDVIKGLF